MNHTLKRWLSLALALVMSLSLAMPALAVEEETGTNTDAVTYADVLKLDNTLSGANIDKLKKLTVQEVIVLLLEKSGLSKEQLGSELNDYNALAKSLGMIDEISDSVLNADCTKDQLVDMLKIYSKLAMAVLAKQPLFLNGMAQPIFPYTSGAVEEGYSNEDSDIIRYSVYVETNYDTDGDGKLDLVKALVQMPRAAAQGFYKAATIYEARPYITGCTNRKMGYDYETGYDIASMYDTEDVTARTPASETLSDYTSALDFINVADSSDWYYYNPFEKMYDYEDLDWYDYYLVRGFAVVECGGLGTRGSEGFETCGSDLEIDAFKCVIEWLTGDRVAYTDKNATTAIEAYWSNGKVGMTGRSYAGTTQFGLASTGVKGLETIVPVAGIASWYDYTNSQGVSTSRSTSYTETLAAYCTGRYLDSDAAVSEALKLGIKDYVSNNDYASIAEAYSAYLGALANQQRVLNGDYSSENLDINDNTTEIDNNTWAIRDYTTPGAQISDDYYGNFSCSALIVHGLSDYNVRPKHFEMIYDAFQEADQNVKILLHQDGHVTPTHPSSGYSFLIGDTSYDEVLNKWFSHYLYGVKNGIEHMAEVTAQDSHENTWNTYDSWEADSVTMFVAGEGTTTISSNYNAVGVTSGNWQETFATGSTLSNAMYVADVTEDMTIKGHVDVTFKASVANEGQAAAVAASVDGAVTPNGVDHDWNMDPANHADEEENGIALFAEEALADRDALMVSAMLVDLSDETFDVFNTSGSYVPKNTLAEDGYWQAGNLKKFDLVELVTSKVNYKVIARGWMDLCNPDAGFVSSSAVGKVSLDGTANEYTISLQPNVYEVAEGHKLAVVLYPYEPSMKSYSQNYVITLDESSIEVNIPVDEDDLEDLTAAYQEIGDVTLNVSAGEGGTVEANVENGLVTKGTAVTVTATANDNYTFAKWTVNGKDGSSNATETFNINADTAIVAHFEKATTGGSNSGGSGSGSGSSGGSHGGGGSSNYTLTFETNGGSALSKVTKSAGTTIDLSAYTTTKSGYTFAGWYADQALTDSVTQVKLSKSMTVYAKWTKVQLSYTDVDKDDWFYEAVDYVTANGIMNGTSKTTFAPALNTTRGMIVTMLYRMEGQPTVTGGVPFTDVAADQYYADAVAWAAANGIVNGTSKTTFAPDQDVTREQLVAILYRYAQYKGYDVTMSGSLAAYQDAASVSTYAVPAMQWAVGAGLINGIGNDLAPQGDATRAQVATMLMRFAEKVAD